MPVITLKIGKLPTEKKNELIKKLTKAAVEVTSIPESSYCTFIEEYDFENIGVGYQTMVERMSSK